MTLLDTDFISIFSLDKILKKDLEPLRISSLTLVPLFPLINFTASSIFMPSVEILSIDNILSLALIPASNAGVPSIGEIIIKSSDSLSLTIWIPTPVNSPEVSILI